MHRSRPPTRGQPPTHHEMPNPQGRPRSFAPTAPSTGAASSSSAPAAPASAPEQFTMGIDAAMEEAQAETDRIFAEANAQAAKRGKTIAEQVGRNLGPSSETADASFVARLAADANKTKGNVPESYGPSRTKPKRPVAVAESAKDAMPESTKKAMDETHHETMKKFWEDLAITRAKKDPTKQPIETTADAIQRRITGKQPVKRAASAPTQKPRSRSREPAPLPPPSATKTAATTSPPFWAPASKAVEKAAAKAAKVAARIAAKAAKAAARSPAPQSASKRRAAASVPPQPAAKSPAPQPAAPSAYPPLHTATAKLSAKTPKIVIKPQSPPPAAKAPAAKASASAPAAAKPAETVKAPYAKDMGPELIRSTDPAFWKKQTKGVLHDQLSQRGYISELTPSKWARVSKDDLVKILLSLPPPKQKA